MWEHLTHIKISIYFVEEIFKKIWSLPQKLHLKKYNNKPEKLLQSEKVSGKVES